MAPVAGGVIFTMVPVAGGVIFTGSIPRLHLEADNNAGGCEGNRVAVANSPVSESSSKCTSRSSTSQIRTPCSTYREKMLTF